MTVTEILRDAQALALFSNLEPKDVDWFRMNYPELVPAAWWDYQTENKAPKGHAPAPTKQWQFNQRLLQGVWKRGFDASLSFIIDLALSVFDPEDLADIWIGTGRQPVFANPGEMPYRAYPYQKAVFYLFEHPWRARFCAECKKRFVAAEPKNKYCSEDCSHENRLRQKRKWFTQHGSQLRADKKNRHQPRIGKPRKKSGKRATN